MKHLKKFIVKKYGLNGEEFLVEVIYKDEIIPEEYSVIDVAYLHNYRKVYGSFIIIIGTASLKPIFVLMPGLLSVFSCFNFQFYSLLSHTGRIFILYTDLGIHLGIFQVRESRKEFLFHLRVP